MRFNKNKPTHWLLLLISGFNAVIAALLRNNGLIKQNDTVLFYGHTLNGNLKAFYDYLEQTGDFKPVFTTMFPSYKKHLKTDNLNVLLTSSLSDSLKMARSSVIITDHGAHFMYPIYKHTSIKFVDVWHGIPYKGWDTESFGEQKSYDEVWVSSDYFVDVYKNKYGFPNNIVATGYARTDVLINGEYSKEMLFKRYKLPTTYKNLILVAPTWKQDSQNRSIIPFGASIKEFFNALNQMGEKTDSLVIFRAHLNSGDPVDVSHYKHVKVMPYARYPIAEEFLAAADLVITDWSSIAFDFLVLKRPVVYMDVEPPFEKGFTLDGSYRFGPVVRNLAEMRKAVVEYTGNTSKYRRDYKEVIDRTLEVAYGNLADGKASNRYLEHLKTLVKGGR